jgi:hypothetical protein
MQKEYESYRIDFCQVVAIITTLVCVINISYLELNTVRYAVANAPYNAR